VQLPDRPLRIAISMAPPLPVPLDPEFEAAARRTGDLLQRAGHQVFSFDPPYTIGAIAAAGLRATAGIAEEADKMVFEDLEPRAKPMVRIGNAIRKLGLVRSGGRDRWRRKAAAFFAQVDVLITPTLAAPPVRNENWFERSILDNTRAATYAPFTNPWNLAGYPAASVPAGIHSVGTPLAVQVVAPDGREARVLSVAKQLEQLAPWPRHAPPPDGRSG
jgi:amidase